ncbi:unnamed protein product [Vitrella brassicaformis CCMP3155]|uniref:Uncharacterized protein n=1 Tax=Vitrella brassicaformis (strain CCMP3155) TaxID=1169540 RepID=A0A0G4GC08_VITBC|nr:unnamed protein product [Vitrella brassicaformis CCMP3155]|mmetsp:Transcript_21685/g.61705  ORF Transcript_21685/g.61705 Transcript_21685/m.61705 type:complete len:637 (-) Transcript_21685:257-2167(-)|eukprot:CEM26645.1 unnamed protein product [Vitrella brassicaformis CCMP3155]
MATLHARRRMQLPTGRMARRAFATHDQDRFVRDRAALSSNGSLATLVSDFEWHHRRAQVGATIGRWTRLLREAARNVDQLSASHAAEIAYFITKSDFGGGDELLPTLFDKTMKEWESLGGMQLHRFLRSMVHKQELVHRPWFFTIADTLTKRHSHLQLNVIKLIIEDFAVIYEYRYEPLFRSIAETITKTSHYLDPKGCVFILHAFARAKYRHEPLINALLPRLETLMDRLPFDLQCLLVRSLANLGCRPGPELLEHFDRTLVPPLLVEPKRGKPTQRQQPLQQQQDEQQDIHFVNRGGCMSDEWDEGDNDGSSKPIDGGTVPSHCLTWVADGFLRLQHFGPVPALVEALLKRSDELNYLGLVDTAVMAAMAGGGWPGTRGAAPPIPDDLFDRMLHVLTTKCIERIGEFTPSVACSTLEMMTRIQKLNPCSPPPAAGGSAAPLPPLPPVFVTFIHMLFFRIAALDARNLSTFVTALHRLNWRRYEDECPDAVLPCGKGRRFATALSRLVAREMLRKLEFFAPSFLLHTAALCCQPTLRLDRVETEGHRELIVELLDRCRVMYDEGKLTRDDILRVDYVVDIWKRADGGVSRAYCPEPLHSFLTKCHTGEALHAALHTTPNTHTSGLMGERRAADSH